MAQASKLFDLSFPAPAARAFVATPAADALDPQSPRKLVRPRLPEGLGSLPTAPRRMRGTAPLVQHETNTPMLRNGNSAASHAEALYFQKQMQTQTQMVFVLEDGERVQGVIEWFDRDTIKVRNNTRVLVFKRSIKYLFKAGGDLQG